MQVDPPLASEDCACGASFLWWSQKLQANHSIWVVAKQATECVKRESAAHAGLAFWARLLASKHLYEIFDPKNNLRPYTPPFTVYRWVHTLDWQCMYHTLHRDIA